MDEIDSYLQTLTQPEREALLRIRDIIKDLAPDAIEVISYGMPGFKHKGKYLAGYYAFKDHLSLFPSGVTDQLGDQLKDFKTSKGTIQFTLDHQLPESLIRNAVQIRLDTINQS